MMMMMSMSDRILMNLYRSTSVVEIIEQTTDHTVPFPRLPITVPSFPPNGVSSRCYPRPSQRDPLIDWKMWFLSRCLSIDSFHSCLTPAKNRTSYDFCFCSDRLKIFSAKSDDEDESSSSKKPLRYQHRAPLRRRLPKRYSDIVGPLATKAMHFHNDPYFVSSQARRASINLPRRHSTKMGTNETFQYLRSSRRKTRQTLPPFPHLKLPETRNFPLKSRRHSDDLAHRMQAVMSSELMHSLDRNFVFGDRNKLYPQYSLVPRSQSFNICTLSNNYNRKVQPNHYHQLIPRVKYRFKQEEELTISELTPDYNEQFILRKNQSTRFEDTKEELTKTVNYQFPTTIHELDEKTLTRTEPGLSSSFIVPASVTSLSNGEQEDEEQEQEEERVEGDEHKQEVQYESPEPPLPPPPKPTTMPKTYLTIRCRTIADHLTPDHKLILKDGDDEQLPIPTQSDNCLSLNLVTPFPPPPASISSYESLSQADENVDDTEMTTICAKRSATTDDHIRDPNLSSSSPATSVFIDQDYEPRSSSSKIYHDYKKRTSSISIPTSSSTRLSNSTLIVHPMHTKIGFRSSTSSSSMRNEKFSSDMTLTGKQMNVCVINQLNEHLSTRFRQHQTEEQEQETYDLPPPEESNISSITPIENNSNENNNNVYDEPNELLMTDNLICSASSSIPPPPPPLPVGGFRSMKNPVHHRHVPPSVPPRTEILSSTRTSTISSNLSDTRILHELRANPLFTRAKEHLDTEPGSSGRRSGRRLLGSTMNLGKNEETVSYLRLNHANKTNHRTSPASKSSMETIILHPNELNRMIGKRTKSSIDLNQSKTSKYLSTTACRQSELEMIFQKRAQRHSQNLS